MTFQFYHTLTPNKFTTELIRTHFKTQNQPTKQTNKQTNKKTSPNLALPARAKTKQQQQQTLLYYI